MKPNVRKFSLKIVPIVVLLLGVVAQRVDAYVDPGTTGMLSQLLYVLFYGVLAVFLYSLRYVKQIMANLRQRLLKPFLKKPEQ